MQYKNKFETVHQQSQSDIMLFRIYQMKKRKQMMQTGANDSSKVLDPKSLYKRKEKSRNQVKGNTNIGNGASGIIPAII